MRNFFCFFLALFLCANVFAEKFQKIVFLGDSLSDNGNLYRLLITLIPKSPPYYNGRFSNGPTWAEHVGKFYSLKNNGSYKIYAYGGATAILHAPSLDFVAPTTLELELDNYLIDSLFKSKKHVLFSIWMGANDYFFEKSDDMDLVSSKVVNKITWTIKKLIENGGRNFLILNLPELSRTPFAMQHQLIPRLQLLTQMHNQKLEMAVMQLKQTYPDIKFDFVNVHDTMNDFIDHPEKYNEAYKVNIRDTTNACWTGGYFFAKSIIEQSLNKDIAAMKINKNDADYDDEAIKNLISSSSELSYTYAMSKMMTRGIVPCINPDQHLFWDDMHPTAVVHRVLSEIIIENLNQNFV